VLYLSTRLIKYNTKEITTKRVNILTKDHFSDYLADLPTEKEMLWKRIWPNSVAVAKSK
jgi:hypothetical protein